MSLCGGLRLIKNRVERQCEFVKEQRVNELVNVSCGRVMYSFLLSCFVIESSLNDCAEDCRIDGRPVELGHVMEDNAFCLVIKQREFHILLKESAVDVEKFFQPQKTLISSLALSYVSLS